MESAFARGHRLGQEILQEGIHEQKYDELTFTDDFMFCKVLENNEDLCRELVELILDKKIEIVRSVQRQKPIEITSDGKGIRLDVRMEGDDTVYGIEMQNGHKEELPRRARYYQAMTDLDLMERGAKYQDLKDSVIIFICTFDPFGRGQRKYTVKKVIEEEPGYDYNDGARLLFLSSLPNQKGTMSEELSEFLRYVNGEGSSSELTRKIDAAVKRAISQRDWRKEYMLLEDYIEEGRVEGRAELVMKMHQKGLADEEIAELTDLPLSEVADITNKDQ